MYRNKPKATHPWRPLSYAEAALNCGEAREKEKESDDAPRARSTFSIVAIFIGILSGSLCGGESLETQR